MKDLKYSEILGANKQLGQDMTDNEYTVGLVSNITINQLKEILEYSLRSEGIHAVSEIGNYDNILQDTAQFSKKNLVVIFWELANIVDGLQYKAGLFEEQMLNELIEKVKSELNFVFNNLKETSHVVINSFSSLVFNINNLEIDNHE